MRKLIEFLDNNQWACWLGIIVGIVAVSLIEAGTV